MNKLRLTPLLVLVLLLAVGLPAQPAYAAPVVVDTFETTQSQVTGDPGPTCGSANGAGIFGSYRDAQVERTSGSGSVLFQAASGTGGFSNPTYGHGTLLLQWDGDTDSCTLPDPDTNKVAATNFKANGASRFLIQLNDVDQADSSIRVRVYERDGASSDYAEYTWSNIPKTAPQTLSAAFTAFTENGNWENDTDWERVSAVTVFVTGVDALDLVFDFIGTDDPTAVTLAGLGATADAALFRWQLAGFLLPVAAVLGLAGVGAWVRMRKQDNE